MSLCPRLMQLSDVISEREVSFSSECWLAQKLTPNPSAEVTVECSATKGHLFHTSASRLRDHYRKSLRMRVQGGWRKSVLWTGQGNSTHRCSLYACIRQTQDEHSSEHPSIECKRNHQLWLQTPQAVDDFWEKSLFSFWMWLLVS